MALIRRALMEFLSQRERELLKDGYLSMVRAAESRETAEEMWDAVQESWPAD